MRIRTGMSLSLVQRQQVRKATINARISLGKAKRIKQSKSTKTSSKASASSTTLRNLLNNKLNASAAASSSIQLDKTTEEQKASYTQMKKMASEMQKYAAKFLATGEKSIFEKATPPEEDTEMGLTEEEQRKETERAEANRKVLTSELLDCLEDFNKMMTSMNKVNSSTMSLYIRQLKQYETEQYGALEDVGVSVEKDGTLTVKEEKLKNADIHKLKKVFHEKGCFLDKVGYKSKNIQSNAEYNLSNLNLVYSSSTYGKNGASYEVGGSTYSAKS